MKSSKHSLGIAAVAAAVLGHSLAAEAAASASSDVSFVSDGGRTVAAELFRPAGSGPLPAVVILRGCGDDRSAGSPVRDQAGQLAADGYLVLLVKSDCAAGPAAAAIADRSDEATAAYRHLARSGLAQPDRIGLIGWADGATAALVAVDRTNDAGYRAAVAWRPACALEGGFGGAARSTWQPSAPVVILHDDHDPGYRNWTCLQRIARAQAAGAEPVSLVVQHGAGSQRESDRVAGSEAVSQIRTLLRG
jgi:dienelactone hydrolase